MPDFHIHVAGDDLVFSAGHFIAFEGGGCERLHGHTYRAAADVFGPLNSSEYVLDFSAVRNALKGILAELDHRVLLPTQSVAIRVSPQAGQVEVTFGDCPDFRGHRGAAVVDENGTVPFGPRRWSLPEGDCLLLPMANTTTEALAQYVGERLTAALKSACGVAPSRMRIEISEGAGCAAICDWRRQAATS